MRVIESGCEFLCTSGRSEHRSAFGTGRTEPFSAAKLQTLYGTAASFIAQWTSATDSAIAKGFILRADRSRLIAIGRKLSQHIE
jgi:hypothetical protein